jgi:hypothetical protein
VIGMSPDEIWGRAEDSDRRSDSQENDSRPLISRDPLSAATPYQPTPYQPPVNDGTNGLDVSTVNVKGL